jgi:Mg-chelatase subunit ChlD
MNIVTAMLRKLSQFFDDDVQESQPDNLRVDPAIYAQECVVDELVVDVSPSMDEPDYPPSRLEGAQKAATRFLNRRREVNPKDLVGIVAFSERAKVIAPPVPVADNFSDLCDAIQSLSTSSCTNIAAGLKLAHREIARVRHPRKPRILLLTDGHSNTGSDPETAASEVKNAGIQLDIIGIGGSPEEVNEPMLKRMASVLEGQRRYWFIRSVGQLVRKFEALALREIK